MSLRRAVAALALAALCSASGLEVLQWPPQRELKIWTSSCPPFSYNSTGTVQGFSVEVWKFVLADVRERAGEEKLAGWNNSLWPLQDESYWSWQTVSYPVLWNTTEAEAPSKFDVVISCITMSPEREQRFDFSHPYFDTGYGIMLRRSEVGTDNRLEDLLVNFLRLCAIVFGVALLFAHVIWAAESRFSCSTYFEGVWDGVWFGVVTMTTVGYGDKYPRTSFGRVLTMIYMIVAMLWFSYFTALLSADLTKDALLTGSIRGISDLKGKRVGVERGTMSDTIMSRQGAEVKRYGSEREVFDALWLGNVDAAVADYPQMAWYVQQSGHEGLYLLPEVFQPFSYALLFPRGSHLRDPVNEALLRWKNDEHQALEAKYFGGVAGMGDAGESATDLAGFNSLAVGSAVFVGTFAVVATSVRFLRRRRTKETTRQQLKDVPVEELFPVGAKVTHEKRGVGMVEEHRLRGGQTCVSVRYKSGETHLYEPGSLHKLTVEEEPDKGSGGTPTAIRVSRHPSGSPFRQLPSAQTLQKLPSTGAASLQLELARCTAAAGRLTATAGAVGEALAGGDVVPSAAAAAAAAAEVRAACERLERARQLLQGAGSPRVPAHGFQTPEFTPLSRASHPLTHGQSGPEHKPELATPLLPLK